MTLLTTSDWQIVAGLTSFAVLAAFFLWLALHKRPTAEELERARRQFLAQSGRLVDGMLLDICEVPAEDGRTLTMLLFSYRISGVDYECSQDITGMGDVVNVAEVRAGFPCTVRYQPGNPQNSIVIAEEWTGLRIGIPRLPAFNDPDPRDLSHLRPSRR
jgi:arginine/ornithine N-succinyltransferase beta subunit